jgi:hypothetical protein
VTRFNLFFFNRLHPTHVALIITAQAAAHSAAPPKNRVTFSRGQTLPGEGLLSAIKRLNFSFFRLLLRALFFQRLLGFLLAVLFHILGLGHFTFLLSVDGNDVSLSFFFLSAIP